MDGFKKHQGFFYYLFERVIKNENICIYGKHNAVRNYVDIRNVVQALRYIVEYGVTGVVNLVHPIDYRLTELVEMMKCTCGSSSKVWFDCDKPDIEDLIFNQMGATSFIPDKIEKFYDMQKTMKYVYQSYRRENKDERNYPENRGLSEKEYF